MKFIAHIDVMPLKELLDPQGKAVQAALKQLGLNQTEDVRIGKHIELTLESADASEARQIAEQACEQLLANPVMEYAHIQIVPAPDSQAS
ncbi:phosphoribosylformylglycinamidine synthase subunit PurS [Thermoflavifilum thermophilum]|uniref:Phosphoribosylformylglycinamidine synthase subunit PurS n=1 Tax=Thermoflavifilum thermophilum TaxID=1393122 RepID=A0A1I7NGV2_9BACT|nr:phosphoribosylformylglycinamidine synthase subunit PurS [Thermoflavifilum thermophilum]SFV33853.1 phosphoribosylformylglycinamidine synthase [Thermoflavifilum thermophilum]